ncbi:nuclear transport factor 2 family protein [Streptomyces sp. 21So2-11]|uniref:nuclear transport factor 2 family protein n=1 Tax=Streptomyces sp. 21So2-11 TaxID=3144408 RepID=UPI00321AEACA
MTEPSPAVEAGVEATIEGELRLLDPAVRASAELLAELLHPEFSEFGASGRHWDRDSIVAALTAEGASAPSPITASRMRGVQLAPDLVHLTFDIRSGDRHSHRSSLWRLTDRGWLLYFHQGTPCSATA